MNLANSEKANKVYTSDFKRKVYQNVEKIWLKTPHSYLKLKLVTSVSYALLTCKNLELSLKKVLRIKSQDFGQNVGHTDTHEPYEFISKIGPRQIGAFI